MKARIVLALCAGLAAGVAVAKLPPPTPEEKAKLEKKAEEKKAETKKQEKELKDVQERVAQRYREDHPDKGTALPAQAEAEKMQKSDVPKSGQQPPGAVAHPYAGRKPDSSVGMEHSEPQTK